MRELKILAVVVALTLVTYWGVEPFAHSQMHPHVAPADFAFSDLKESVSPVKALKGDATNGETLVTSNCTAYKRHILTKKTTKNKRNLRKPAMVDATNVKNMKKILPYA
jgi:ribosomal protein L35